MARHIPSQIRLFETYHAAAEFVVRRDPDAMLVVANAFDSINHFYISSEFEPAAAFFCNTPAYVIAARDPTCLSRPKLTVATHPAPSHLIREAIPDVRFSLREATSTSAAAELAAAGIVDACLTTRTAADLSGLVVLKTAVDAIPMLWSVFIKRGRS